MGGKSFSEALSLNTADTKTCTMAYQTLSRGFGIHHGNTGIQITPAQSMKCSFMLVFDLTPDGCNSDGHTSLPNTGNILIELKFDEALAEAVTILLYQVFDASIQIDRLSNIFTDFWGMHTLEIYRTLSDVPTFAGVFPSDLLPTHPLPGLVKYTLIVNTDAHTEPSSHWVAVHLDMRFSTGYYSDSYRLFPLVPTIRRSLRQVCTLWSYNTRTLQGFTTDVCGQYACLFALCMDTGFVPHQFVKQFGTTEPT